MGTHPVIRMSLYLIVQFYNLFLRYDFILFRSNNLNYSLKVMEMPDSTRTYWNVFAGHNLTRGPFPRSGYANMVRT